MTTEKCPEPVWSDSISQCLQLTSSSGGCRPNTHDTRTRNRRRKPVYHKLARK